MKLCIQFSSPSKESWVLKQQPAQVPKIQSMCWQRNPSFPVQEQERQLFLLETPPPMPPSWVIAIPGLCQL